MAKQAKPDVMAVRPLWILANLLLTIAVCLLLVVIKNRLSDSHKESSTPESVSENQPPMTTDRGARSTLRITSRQTVNSRRAAEAAQSPAVGDAVEAAPESSPVPPDRILPPAPVGVIATVIASATNFTTAIAGRVTLRGEPPPEKPIDMSNSPPCAKLQTNSPTTRFFVIGPDGGLADVLVSIVDGLDRKRYEAAPTNHELVFVNCQIQPYVSAIMAGQRVLFRSADQITHNVQLTTTNNPEVNLTLMARSVSRVVRLPSPENFLRVKCDVHPWEFAYLSVLEHPFFAVTDTNGDFVIPNVPPGKYTLRAWHRKAQATNSVAHVTVSVYSGKISQVSFILDAPDH